MRGKYILSSIDRAHPISGIRQKLLAYKAFLEKFPRYRTKVCLVQFLVQQSEFKGHKRSSYFPEIDQAEKELQSIVDEINTSYPGALCYIYRNLSKSERLALWSESNILFITSLRDGQCISPLEFITVKKAENKLDKANIITSEFSGNNSSLGGILVINPFNVDEITKTIDVAMQMLPEEREQRLELAYSFIKNNSTQKWASGFITDLKRNSEQVGDSEFFSTNKFVGLGLQSTLIRTQNRFRELNTYKIAENFMKAKNRLILINQEGVLPFFQKCPVQAVKDSLKNLS